MTAIPCKRPNVAVEFHPMVGDLDPATHMHTGRHVVICYVTGCDFPRKYHAVKAGAQEEARWHRDAHKSAVPAIETTDLGIYIRINCACGHEHRVHGTKSDAAAHIDHHLSSKHGLVAS